MHFAELMPPYNRRNYILCKILVSDALLGKDPFQKIASNLLILIFTGRLWWRFAYGWSVFFREFRVKTLHWWLWSLAPCLRWVVINFFAKGSRIQI